MAAFLKKTICNKVVYPDYASSYNSIISILADFGYPVLGPLVVLLPKIKLFGFPIFRFERTWWMLFNKRAVRTK